MGPSETETALRRAADGLTYQSETDALWATFSWPSASGKPTVAGVRTQTGLKPNAPVEQVTLDAFFAPLVEQQQWFGDEEKAIAQRYHAIFEAVRQLLTDAVVVRVGKRKVTVYVVGVPCEGGWAGLKTQAVET